MAPREHIVLVGPPGAGKGTQSEKLLKLGFSHFSTGDALRKEMATGSDFGKQVAEIINDGNFVDDDTMLEIIKRNVEWEKEAYIFDGYPRNLAQAEKFHNVLMKGREYKVLWLDVPEAVLLDRLQARRICSKCRAVFNTESLPSRKGCLCDREPCGAELSHREDDREEVILKRFRIFQDVSLPMKAFFKEKGCLLEFDASLGIDEVSENIVKKLAY